MFETSQLKKALWKNSLDSIQHALDHFWKLRQDQEERCHHVKWAVLSVHHAAECFCYIRLLELAPNEADFYPKGKPRPPGLHKALNNLKRRDPSLLMPLRERRLLKIFENLNEARDQIIHRTVPDDLEPSVAAISLLGLLRIAERQEGDGLDDIPWESPQAESDVFEAISYKRVEEYCRRAEEWVREEYPDALLYQCPLCLTESIVDGALPANCEVCFQEMWRCTCPETGGYLYLPRWWKRELDVNCPDCGQVHEP